MSFIEQVYEKLARHPKRIVFPEGTDARVVQAAGEYVKRKLGPAILLGRREEIAEVARTAGVGLVRVHVIDPSEAEDLDMFCTRLVRLPRYRDMVPEEARKTLLNPNYFAAMMLQGGQADAMVSGACTTSGGLLRPLFSLVKPLPGFTAISSCMVIRVADRSLGDNGVFFCADCGVIPEPTVEQLATIAVETGKVCRQLTGRRPKVAMLSYSTRGSAQTRHTERVAAATALARKLAADQNFEMDIDGELQVDAALVPAIASRKVTASAVAGNANVLIFPDLNSGNIATKMVQWLGGAEAYGHILIGISKPAADVSRGAKAEDITGVAAILGLRCIAYRELYPDQGASADVFGGAGPAGAGH